MPRVLITGMSGFVGSCAGTEFRRRGWEVAGIGRRQSDQPGYMRFDLSLPFAPELEKAIQESDVVIHAAARSSPWGSKKQFHLANEFATQQLLDACEAGGKPKFIFISSSSVYYEAKDQLQIDESTPQAAPSVNLYAASKQKAESLVREYSGAWTILRPRAVYGRGDTVLFPRILKAAEAGKLPLLIRSGSPAIGDLIAIDNLVECLFQAAARDEIIGDYNLTDNAPQEIVPFLVNIFEQLGIPKPRRQLNVRTATALAGLLEYLYRIFLPHKEPPITRFGVHVFAWSKTFNVEKMVQTFGSPRISTDEAVKDFVDWVQRERPYDARKP